LVGLHISQTLMREEREVPKVVQDEH